MKKPCPGWVTPTGPGRPKGTVSIMGRCPGEVLGRTGSGNLASQRGASGIDLRTRKVTGKKRPRAFQQSWAWTWGQHEGVERKAKWEVCSRDTRLRALRPGRSL